ncbi:MAG TPA: Calx-beta domain-containing protein [Pyrinomonadaceae bacterium]
MRGKGQRLFLVAAVVLMAATVILLVERAGAAAGTFVQQGKLEASDGAAQDSLGFAVAVSGDTAVVGAPADAVGANPRQGSAYVYVRNGSTWTQQQKLTAGDGIANDEFGYAVAIQGDTIFVGRHFTQAGNNARTRGAVYVYTRSGTTWTQSATLLTPSDAADGDLFGSSLAVDNDTLVVGALQKNNATTFFQGAAYVFTGAGATWTQQAKLLANDGGFANFFGVSVAVGGDTAVVGATGQAGISADSGRGSAYVFTRSGSAWSQQQKLLASDGAAGDAFGFSVGVSGETAVVGSRLDNVNGVGGQGSVYVFTRSGTVWSEQQHLFGVEATQRNDTFGGSVAIEGDTIAVGSPAHEIVPGIANHGAVYVFTRSGTTWTRQQKLIHSDPAPDALGTSVALDGTTVVAGAPSKNSARGAAYVFAIDPNAGPKLVANDGATQDRLGYSVAVYGDTAVVGAPEDDANQFQNRGSAYVYVRANGAWTQQQKLLVPDPTIGDRFGTSVAINGDTIVVGSPNHDTPNGDDVGAAFVFVRTGSTWTFQQKLMATGGVGGDWFGQSVALDGDTAVVGAIFDGNNGTAANQGAAYVFTRAGAAWTQRAVLRGSDSNFSDWFGAAVSISGNTIAVGAPIAETPVKGAAFVFTGAGATWTQQQKLPLPSDLGGADDFGASISVSGDTVVVGARLNDHGTGASGSSNQGAAYVFQRSGTTWTQQQKLTATDAGLGDEFGQSVAVEGNTVVVGARTDSFGTSPNVALNQGSAYVFTRGGSAWTQAQKLSAFDGAAQDQFGWAVALSGSTAVVGAYLDDVEGQQDQGSAYVFNITTGSNPTPTPTPTPTGSVQFTTATVQAEEGPGSATVTSGVVEWWQAVNAAAMGSASLTVTRTDTTQAASVDYATVDGTANGRTDYTAVYGTLRFAAGEASKSIVVQVTDDRFEESVESFSVVLSNPVGVNLGSPSSATVQVTSDDTTTGPNPVADETFDVDFFVRQHYADFLGREADAAGLQFWKDEITQCESRPEAERQGCREVKRVNVSAAFFLSIEFQQTGYFVYLLHQAAYASGEHLAATRFLADAGEVRRDVVVGATGWEDQLAANKQAFALAFVQRPEFAAAYPASMTPAQFVDALNANAGGSLSQAERDARVAELTAANTNAGRASVLLKLPDDADFRQREFNKAFVLMQYFGYLRRAPNESPDSNFDGYNFWLGKLNEFNGNFITAEMVKAFITSIEYRQRFGP